MHAGLELAPVLVPGTCTPASIHVPGTEYMYMCADVKRVSTESSNATLYSYTRKFRAQHHFLAALPSSHLASTWIRMLGTENFPSTPCSMPGTRGHVCARYIELDIDLYAYDDDT